LWLIGELTDVLQGQMEQARRHDPRLGNVGHSDIPAKRRVQIVTGMQLTILGPVRAWRGEAELDLGPPQQRGALAFLALNAGKPVSAPELISALWADQAPPGARGTVRTYVYKLRQNLGREALESSSSGYTLAAGAARVDLDDFCQLADEARAMRARGARGAAAQRLGQALALWRGQALAGARGHYVDKQRGWLNELRLTVLEERFSLALDLGRHAEVIAELTKVVTAEPFRERMRELLMVALYRSGRQADALASYRDLRTILRREAGLDPAPALQQVHDQILQADPELLTLPPDPGRMAPAPLRRPAPRIPHGRREPQCAPLARTHDVGDRDERSR
jgi:DNA-binding SARP family transcriptional activator